MLIVEVQRSGEIDNVQVLVVTLLDGAGYCNK